MTKKPLCRYAPTLLVLLCLGTVLLFADEAKAGDPCPSQTCSSSDPCESTPPEEFYICIPEPKQSISEGCHTACGQGFCGAGVRSQYLEIEKKICYRKDDLQTEVNCTKTEIRQYGYCYDI